METSNALRAALDTLRGLDNYERGFAPYGEARYDPGKVGAMLIRCGIDVSGMRIIHVAGTKGKGSASHYAHAVLRALFPDEPAGLYTSPHLFRVNERIRVNDTEISDEAIERIVMKRFPMFRETGCTWFDAFTFLAMEYFSEAACRWVILETGLGGRLDSTNFCRPAVSVITPVGYDHTALLGKTLAAIAGEKAGIIKHGVPVVTAKQNGEALEVIRTRAEECGSPLATFNEAVKLSVLSRTPEGSTFDAEVSGIPVRGIRCVQAGDVFAENLLLAALAVKEALPFPKFVPADWANALKTAGENVHLPGRMEKHGDLLFDVSHNDQSFRALFDTLRGYFHAGCVDLCVGILADKELECVAAVIRTNAELLHRLTVFDFPSERPSGGKTLAALLEGMPGLRYVESPANVEIDPDTFTVVAGSFHSAEWFLEHG
jgi:dihydrofolate synthase/folylpolyglutamate synthase